jgi:hypothetical protein
MKKYLVLLLLCFVCSVMDAQRITREFRNVSMSKALKLIESSTKDYTINFIYNELEDFTVTTTVSNKSVPDAIREIIGFYPIRMTVDGTNIFVECVQKESTKLTGRVIDKSGHPVMYANVALLSPRDSSYITGGVSNEAGQFVIPCAAKEVWVKISCIGYRTKIISTITNTDLGAVRLEEEKYNLQQVVVHAKKFQLISDGILANVSGTELGKLGYAPDVLKHLPFVTQKGEDFIVFGKGIPVIYIDNRIVRDNNELKQLNSSDIKQVKVITNPGAEYDASTNAVIKIITVKSVGNGFSGMFDGGMSVERKVSHQASARINYRSGGFDIFGSMQYNADNSNADQTATTLYGNRKNEESVFLVSRHFVKRASLGINNQFGDKLSAGIRYNYMNTPNNKFDCYENLNAYKDNALNNQISSTDNRRYIYNQHYVNSYINYDFSKDAYLKFDGDLLNIHQTDKQYFGDADGSTNTRNKSINQLYAGRLILALPLCSGQLKSGVEASYTKNDNKYHVLDGATLQTALSSTANKAEQHFYAGFLEYARSFGDHWNVKTGIRYEHTNFDYYIDGKKSDEVSQTNNGFYPSASIGYDFSGVQMSLAYRYTTVRPSYFSLRSAIAMNTPYSYEGGNPKLQPRKTNMLTYSLKWGDFQLMTSYSYIKDASIFVQEMYNQNDSIVIDQFRNVNKHSFDLSLYYTPKLFKIWTPEITAELTKQFMTYLSKKFNKPCYYFEFKNRVKLSHSYLLGCDMNYSSAYHSNLVYQHADFDTDIYGIKTFLNDRLRLNLKVSNLFNTSRQRWDMNQGGITLNLWNNEGRRTLEVSVTYRFNQTKSKYKGEVSTDELNRM